MSKRQENLKKSLGISEYPWSSDDDEHGTTPVVSEYLLRRHENETRHSVADMPGTSASVQPVQTSELSPTSRRTRNTEHTRAHAKIDRDTFWSLVNSTHRISVPRCSYNNTVNNNRGSMSISPVMPHNGANSSNGENVGRRSTSDVILTFKKLNRNLPCRSTRSATNLLSIQRGGAARSSSSTLFSRGGAFSTDLTAIIKAREHRRSRNAQQGPLAESSRSGEEPSTSSGISRSQPLGGSDNNPDGIATMEPINIEHSEEEAEMPPVALSPIATNDNETQMQEGESHNTTAMSVEEEVVEIDAEPEGGPAAGDAAGPDGAQAPDGETANESNEAAQQPHGVKRKRDAIEESEPSTVKEFNQNLLRLLECPVCLEWMEPPMSQCRRGHLVCGRCRARLASCPVCRTAFSSVRNRAMEGVAEMLRYPCRHGCGREVRLRRRGPHEASCGARRYRCPACPDRSPLPHRDLAPHFQSKHLPILKIGRKHRFSMKVNSEQHDNWMIMALHELFHLRVDVDIRTWGVVVYVAYIGPMCKANNFTYEVIVTGQHNSRKLTYTRETHSDLESSSLTVSRQDCFHLTIDQALNFLRVKNRYCEPDKFLNFTVEITQAEGDANRDESDS